MQIRCRHSQVLCTACQCCGMNGVSEIMTNTLAGSRLKPGLGARTHLSNMLFLLPTVLLFLVVVLIPVLQGIPYSFTSWKSIISTEHPFNGLANYRYLLGNKYFRMSLMVTFSFTIQYMLLSMLFGFGLALLIYKASRFNNVCRTIFFLPFTTSVTAGAIVWSYVYTDMYGTLTGLVSPLGLPNQIVPAMALMASWRDMGYAMLIFIAALQTVPHDYYEAATVEGANTWQQFIHITLPNIVPAFTTNTTLLLAWGLRTFDLPAVVAQNMQEGQTTAFYIYQSIFANNKASLGQAAAIILTVILIVLTQIVTRSLRRLEVEA